MTCLSALLRYCEPTPKMHQWLHQGRCLGTWAKHGYLRFKFVVCLVSHLVSPGLGLCSRNGENPSFHSCWLNESDNRTICRIAASCHRRVFEERVLKSWELLQAGSFHAF